MAGGGRQEGEGGVDLPICYSIVAIPVVFVCTTPEPIASNEVVVTWAVRGGGEDGWYL